METLNLSQRQIMVSFAYLAYSGEQITTASPEQQILGLINQGMPQIPPLVDPVTNKPDWNVVWGPEVFTVPGAVYQDNMAFVAQRISDPTQLVVAIRGTNGVAELDWLMQDLDVLQMTNWPLGASDNAAKGQISVSTSVGLSALLTLTSSLTDNSTLVGFLTSQMTASGEDQVSVCVTGHSKGGALSSTLALYLKDNQSTWDANSKAIVSNISFAGPTAGDQNFASYSDSQFQGAAQPIGWDSHLTTTCDRVQGSLDVAPLAWDANNIDTLFDLYDDNLTLHFIATAEWDYIKPMIENFMSERLAGLEYLQVQASAIPLPGSFNPPNVEAETVTDWLEAFVLQAGWQHLNAYPLALQVPALLQPGVIVRMLPIVISSS